MDKHAPFEPGDYLYNNMSGIYIIVNRINGRCYIGSASRIRTRFAGHKYLLRRNKHHCTPLQNAWNKYTEDSFDFEVLEYCDPSKLLEREQLYLDSITGLYNVAEFAFSRLGIIQGPKAVYKDYPALRSPEGEVYGPATNLKKFCEIHSLSYKLMNQVIHRTKCSHKGWTLADPTIPKTRSTPKRTEPFPPLKGPQDQLVTDLYDATQFCKENALDTSSFYKMLAGQYQHTKGWRLANG